MKALAILMSLLLCIGILCGCTGEKDVLSASTPQQFSCIRYPGTDWSMTASEFFTALEIPPESFTQTEALENGCAVTYYWGSTVDYFGEAVELKARFSALPYDNIQTLRKVTIEYDRALDDQEFTAYCKQLYRLLKKQQKSAIAPLESRSPGEPLWQTFYSEETTSDFSAYTLKRINAVRGYYSEEDDDGAKTGGFPENLPLSQVQAICPKKEPRLLVLFSGEPVSAALRQIDLYDEIQR